MFYGRTTLPNLVPLPKPPEELRVAARAAITAAGYTPAPSGSASGFWNDNDYLTKVGKENQSPDRWDNLGAVWPPALALWYRESVRGMTPFGNFGTITYDESACRSARHGRRPRRSVGPASVIPRGARHAREDERPVARA